MVSAVSGAVSAGRAGETAGLKLLRADLMPVLVAILGSRFAERRTIAHPEFVLMVADDLDALRGLGFDLPRAAQEYVSDWVRDGYLVRSEVAAHQERMRAQRRAEGEKRLAEAFAAADLNRDGKLSRVEVDEKMPRLSKRFAWMDDNRDGFLGKAELQAGQRR